MQNPIEEAPPVEEVDPAQRFKEFAEAVNEFYEKSQNPDGYEKPDYNDMYERFQHMKLELNGMLYDQGKVFEVLEVAYKLTQGCKNYMDADPTFFIISAYDMFEDADYLLIGAIQKLEPELHNGMGELSEERTDLVVSALRRSSQSPYNDFAIETSVELYRRHKGEILAKGSAVINSKVADMDDWMDSYEFAENIALAINADIRTTSWSKIRYCEDLFREVLERYGLNSERTIASWMTRQPSEGHYPDFAENLKTIEAIETAHKGAVKFLQEKFGIRNFDRYPAALLIAQYENYDKNDLPYGVIINPHSDWNGAFSQDKERWQKLYEDTAGLCYLRVMECEGKYTLVKGLVRMDRKYGDQHKIAFAFIGGHGDENTIEFGGFDAVHRVSTQDLQGKGTERSSAFFEEDATLVLASCSTGVKGGIAQELSEKLKLKVIAPNGPSNIDKITPVINEKRGLNFYVLYANAKGKAEPTLIRMYDSGNVLIG